MQPSIDVDIDKKYIVEVIGITEAPSQFENSREGQMSLTWKFNLYDLDTNIAVIDSNSNLSYELWNFTPDTTYRNTKTGKTAKAREWTEALIGRELTDEQMNDLIDLGFEESLLHKRGLADLEWYVTKSGNERLRIIRLRPYKKNAAPVATQPAEPATAGRPGRSPEEVAARRKALGLDDAA